MRSSLTLFSLVLLLFTISLNAQKSLGIYASVSHGNSIEQSNIDYFDSDHAYSFGLILSKSIKPNFNLVYQASHEQVGWISENFGDEDPPLDVYFKGKALSFSFGGEVYAPISNRIKIGLLVLPKLGYFYDQDYELYQAVQTGIIELFTDRNPLIGLDSRLNLTFGLSDVWELQARPGYSLITSFDGNGYKARNWSFDLGILKRI